MQLVLRKGIEKDLPQVLALIKELAVFEKAPDEVEVSLEQMQHWGFGSDKIFDFYVLEKDSKIIGMALYYFKYSTWKGKCLFLEDLIITEAERKNGYGKLLFNQIIKVAKEQKVKRMEWQVLDWNTPAIEFYKSYQADLDPTWINGKLRYEQLQSL
jgi:N-acetylglutamate synthase-like GNAT family acetyltransferase